MQCSFGSACKRRYCTAFHRNGGTVGGYYLYFDVELVRAKGEYSSSIRYLLKLYLYVHICRYGVGVSLLRAGFADDGASVCPLFQHIACIRLYCKDNHFIFFLLSA